MKSRFIYLLMLALVAFSAQAQKVENDDMYFNAKDRLALNATKPVRFMAAKEETTVASTINPTDSYSARNVNPEYISRSKVDPSSQQSGNSSSYFVPNFQPKGVNQNLASNNYSNYNSFNNPYYYSPYSNYGFGSPYSSFYPYNSFGYSPMMSMGYGGYGYSPWSSMFSLGLGCGYGSMWGSPSMSFWNNYYGMNSFGYSPWGYNSMLYGYGYNPYSYYGNYYGGNTVIINGSDYNGRGAVYGKRASRSTDIDNSYSSDNRNVTTVDSHGRNRGSSGRVSDGSSTYYNSSWRSNPSNNNSGWNNSGRTSGNSWDNGNSSNSHNSWFDNSGSRNSNWNNSNANWGGSNFGGGRSSGISGSGGAGSSGSGGRTRGRD